MAKAEASRGLTDIDAFRRLARQGRGGRYFYVTLLGLEALEMPELLGRVEAGFSYEMLERFQRNLDFSVEELANLVQIKPRTLARRRAEGRLTAEESDRLLRASRVFGKVLALFEGDVDAARKWFATPALALSNRTPRELSATDIGAREVEELIGRLEHGVFS